MNSVKSYLWYLCLTTVFQVYPGEPVPAWFPSSICNWTESSGKSGTGFLQAGSPSRHPTNGVKAPKKSLRPMSHLQFYCEILSRDKIASVTRRVVQLINSRTIPFPIRAALYSVQLCRKNAVNADWSNAVYATKLQWATRHVTLAILSRNFIARQNLKCDMVCRTTSQQCCNSFSD